MQTKLFSSVLCFSLSLFITQHVYGEQKMLAQKKCPSVSAIRSVGVDYAEGSEGRWAAFHKSATYDTNDTWSFFIGVYAAKDADDALNQARDSLTTLTFTDGPLELRGGWICMYEDNDEHLAVAGTPPMNGLNSLKHALYMR